MVFILDNKDQLETIDRSISEIKIRRADLLMHVFEFKHITYINISGLKLECIPPEIGQLVNLQSLECYYNELTNLPSEIGQLVNLQKLFCFSNKLTNLP